MDIVCHEDKEMPANYVFDAKALAQVSIKQRLEMIDCNQVAMMASVGGFRANSEVQFTTRSNGTPKILGLEVHWSIAFKLGTNMEYELKILKSKCKELYEAQIKQDRDLLEIIELNKIKREKKDREA